MHSAIVLNECACAVTHPIVWGCLELSQYLQCLRGRHDSVCESSFCLNICTAGHMQHAG